MRLTRAVVLSLIASVGVLAAGPAQADVISFQTSGVFGSTGTNTVSGSTGNPFTITFTGVEVTDADVDAALWLGSFGTFDVTGGPSNSAFEDTFLLTITQVEPSGDTLFSATVAGQIQNPGGEATIIFSDPLTREIAGYLYTILNPDGVVQLPNLGSVTIDGQVVHRHGDENGGSVPEPAALVLFGMALLGSGIAARSRRLSLAR